MIVLNPQGGRLSGTYRRAGLRLDYHVHHLWDETPDIFLRHETLYPLAVLAQAGGVGEREAVFQNVIDKADPRRQTNRAVPGTGNTDRAGAARTISIAATLASIYLARSTIRTILERNNTMTVLLRDFPLSQSFIEEG